MTGRRCACYRRNPLTHLADYRHCPAFTFQCGANDQQVPPDGVQRFVASLRPLYGEQSERLAAFYQPTTAHKFTDVMWQNGLRWFAQNL